MAAALTVAAAFMLLPARSASAEVKQDATPPWSATLLVQDIGFGGVRGCYTNARFAFQKCSTAATLTENQFTIDGSAYSFEEISIYEGNLYLRFDKAVPKALRSYSVHVGDRTFALGDAITDPRIHRHAILGNVGLEWSKGDKVEMSLRPTVRVKSYSERRSGSSGDGRAAAPYIGYDVDRSGPDVHRTPARRVSSSSRDDGSTPSIQGDSSQEREPQTVTRRDPEPRAEQGQQPDPSQPQVLTIQEVPDAQPAPKQDLEPRMAPSHISGDDEVDPDHGPVPEDCGVGDAPPPRDINLLIGLYDTDRDGRFNPSEVISAYTGHKLTNDEFFKALNNCADAGGGCSGQ